MPEGPVTILPYAIPHFQLFQVGLDDVSSENQFGIALGALARIAGGRFT